MCPLSSKISRVRYSKSVLAAALFVLGCSSSSATHPTTDAGNTTDGGSAATPVGTTGGDADSCGSSPAAWLDDGVLRCGTTGEAIFNTNNATNPEDGGTVVESSLDVVIVQGNTPFTFSIIVTTSESFGGSYTCVAGPTSVVELQYDDVGVFTSVTSSCSVNVTLTPSGDGGMIAAGTFSAQLTLSDGGVKTLSDGTFTFAVTNE